MIVLPAVSNNADYSYTIELDQDTYELRFQWNPRQSSWQLFIGYIGLDPVVKIKLVVGIDLLASYRHIDGVPKGILMLADTMVKIGRPSFHDFGESGRFALVYFTAEERLSGVII